MRSDCREGNTAGDLFPDTIAIAPQLSGRLVVEIEIRIALMQELDDPLAKLALLLIALRRNSANELIDFSDKSEPNEIVYFEGSIHQDEAYYITNNQVSDSEIILRSRDEDLGSLTLDEEYYLVGVTKGSNSGTVVRPLVIYSE